MISWLLIEQFKTLLKSGIADLCKELRGKNLLVDSAITQSS